MNRINTIIDHLLTDRLARAACLAFSCWCLMVPAAFGKTADYMEIGNIQNVALGTWTGIGGLTYSRDFCASSADNDAVNPPPSATTRPYQLKVSNSAGPGGDFYLYLNNDTAATGNQRIRVTLQHRDTMSGNSFEQLAYNSYDTHSHNGQYKTCGNGNNSQLRIEISAGELTGKLSGSYRGDFTVTGRGGSSGTAVDTKFFRVTLTVQASPEVRVSSLTDLSLGSHNGLGNLYAEENFCVYSTSASGSYSLTVSSPNQDGSGNFYLAGGVGQIPYDLYFTDKANGPGTVKVSKASVSGFGNSLDQFCNGQDNATLSVSVSEQALQQAVSGGYSDSLVILVAPQ